jgi:hypothetical protein
MPDASTATRLSTRNRHLTAGATHEMTACALVRNVLISRKGQGHDYRTEGEASSH